MRKEICGLSGAGDRRAWESGGAVDGSSSMSSIDGTLCILLASDACSDQIGVVHPFSSRTLNVLSFLATREIRRAVNPAFTCSL